MSASLPLLMCSLRAWWWFPSSQATEMWGSGSCRYQFPCSASLQSTVCRAHTPEHRQAFVSNTGGTSITWAGMLWLPHNEDGNSSDWHYRWTSNTMHTALKPTHVKLHAHFAAWASAVPHGTAADDAVETLCWHCQWTHTPGNALHLKRCNYCCPRPFDCLISRCWQSKYCTALAGSLAIWKPDLPL